MPHRKPTPKANLRMCDTGCGFPAEWVITNDGPLPPEAIATLCSVCALGEIGGRVFAIEEWQKMIDDEQKRRRR